MNAVGTSEKRSRANTREHLIDAAAALFAEHGTQHVRIEDVCAGAGYTRGAFYSNFSTVEDLLFALYERKTADLLGHLAAAGASLHDVRTLDEGVDVLLRLIPAEPDWYALRASFAARAAQDPEKARILREHGEEMRRGLTAPLMRVMESTGLALAMDTAEATRVIIAAHVGAVLQAPLVDDPERLRHDTMLTAFRGLIIPSGQNTSSR